MSETNATVTSLRNKILQKTIVRLIKKDMEHLSEEEKIEKYKEINTKLENFIEEQDKKKKQ